MQAILWAEFVEQGIRHAGHVVRLYNTQDRSEPISFDGINKVVLAAPVHGRRHPEGFEVFVSSSQSELKARETLLISVSLKAALPDDMKEAQDYLTEKEMRTGFEPDREILAAGAVRPGSYGHFESQIVRNVVLADRKIDLFDGVREFTDWDALGTEIDAFLMMKS